MRQLARPAVLMNPFILRADSQSNAVRRESISAVTILAAANGKGEGRSHFIPASN